MPNPTYEIILYWSNEDQSIMAEVPELAGCIADGANYQEAIANVETTRSAHVRVNYFFHRNLQSHSSDKEWTYQ